MLFELKLYNFLPIGGLAGVILIGGLIIGAGLGPIVIPPEGTPCLDRHVMCAPETNHSPDLHEEPQPPSRGFVATQTTSPIAIGSQDLVRKPQ